MRHGDFDTLGIQTVPFAGLRVKFILKCSQIFHFHTGEPILITPEGQFWGKEELSAPELVET